MTTKRIGTIRRDEARVVVHHGDQEKPWSSVTSRRKPSSTMRIFSSGLHLRRVTDLTRRRKDLVSWPRSSAASALSVSDWTRLLLS